MRQLAYESPTGARLNVNFCEPASGDKPKAIIQINHGMAEHSARYRPFMEALAKAGYASIAHDHRGHGLTTAPDAQQGQFGRTNGFSMVLDDVLAINSWAREHWPHAPVTCLGHSMGGIIALNFACRNRDAVNALAIWNISFDTGIALEALKALLLLERWRKGSDVPSLLAKKLTFDAWNASFKPNRTGYDWLSRDEAEVDQYVADPLCGFPVSIGLWLDVLNGISTANNQASLYHLPKNLPINLQAGSQDPCTANGTAMERLFDKFRTMRQSDVTLNVIDGARHESLHETNRDETASGFIAWLDQRFADSSS